MAEDAKPAPPTDELTPEEEAEAERIASDPQALVERARKDGAVILLKLGKMMRKAKGREIPALAREMRVWYDALMGQRARDDE